MRTFFAALAATSVVPLLALAITNSFPCCGTEPDIYPRSMRIPKPQTSWVSRETMCCVRKGKDKVCDYDNCQ